MIHIRARELPDDVILIHVRRVSFYKLTHRTQPLRFHAPTGKSKLDKWVNKIQTNKSPQSLEVCRYSFV